MKEEVKGLYWAIFLSAIAILAVNWIWPAQEAVVEEKPVAEIKAEVDVKTSDTEKTDSKLYSPSDRKIKDVETALKQDKRISIRNDKLNGSIRIKGARIDNLNLSKYKKTLDENSPDVELLSPAETISPYYAEFGWLSTDSSVKLPNSKTMWKVVGKELTPETPLTLEWNNGLGIKFVRRISLDKNYMFNIEQIVENNSGKDLKLYPYGMVNRMYIANSNSAVVHEGMVGVVDGKLREFKPNDLDEGENEEFTSQGGWAGFGERYWFSAFTLNNSEKSTVRFSKTAKDTYQTDYVGSAIDIANGTVATSKTQFYAGAKEIALLDEYTKTHDIEKFDLAVDFGWYYFLTKPFFYILDFLYKMIGNMGWAILVFAALLRLVMFPVANKSYENMSKIKKVQPKIQAIQEEHKDNKARLQQEMMELYKKEKINPASGCLPMFIQIPVFFSLYKVLNIAIEIRHAEFIGWIKDLSAPDPMTISYFTGVSLPSFFDLGVWPLFMGITMYLQQRMSPKPANKDQARMFMLMPIFFMFMLGQFASGLVIYWTLSNLLSIIQQRAIMKKNGA